MKSTLYYVTLDLNMGDEITLKPEVSDITKGTRGQNRPHVRLAPSISDYIAASPSPGTFLKEEATIKVYKCNAAEKDSKAFWFPEYLYKNDIVRNAFATKETWCLEPIEMSGSLYKVVETQAAPTILFDMVSVNDVLRAFQKIEQHCPIGSQYIDVHDAEWLYDQLSRYLHDNDNHSGAHALYTSLCKECGCGFWDITSLELRRLDK